MPAKAGIHFDLARRQILKAKMDSRLRGNDGFFCSFPFSHREKVARSAG
jgi:hypothetical protein